MRVIGCDTHFDTRIDDVVIAKKSLHGQLFLNHGKLEEIEKNIEMLEQEMREAAKNLDFERAMELRDIIFEMKSQ